MGTSDAIPVDPTAADPTADPALANPYSLHAAVRARRSEYVRRHRIRIKVGTWNVAACPGTDKDLARWFVDGEGLDPALGPSGSLNTGGAAEAPGRAGRDGPAEGDEPVQLAGDSKIGLYVLGLQEINMLSAPGQYMTWIYAADTTSMDRWKAALEAALPGDYRLVVAEQLAGMLLLAYASPEIAPTISNVSATSVATGALGYLGNKGAVCARIVLGETTQVVFVNCHLASGVEDYYVERRINQVQQVVSQARFEPISIAGVSEDEKTKIGDEDFAFWFGDLNSRLDRLPGDDIRRLLMLHTRGEYDLSKSDMRRQDSLDGEPIVVHGLPDGGDEAAAKDPPAQQQDPSEPARDKAAEPPQAADDDSLELPDPDEFPPDPRDDPASLQATLDSLLPHDQLRRLVKERRVFHEGWREGPIAFLPTYKYDVGSVALFDSSEKRRPPSWCDRILYRTRRDLEEYERRVREEEEARRKDAEMKARGIEDAADEDQILFSYDTDNDGDDPPSSASFEYDAYDEAEDGGDEQAHAAEADGDRIRLDLYTSHQRITSSDHKPVSSIFTIDYDAVVPELKAKVHAEVVRELDRAENEGRPTITVVVDRHDVRGGPSGHVDFGELRFLKKETSSLTLANTGRVPATFSFVEKPTSEDTGGADNALPLSRWLTTSFVHSGIADDGSELVELGQEVTLEPGETVGAVLEALVDDIAHARMLNEGRATLEEVLVLRVTDGRDHFIPVRASWAPTCIGRSIEELIRVPDGGIRAFAKTLAEAKGAFSAIPDDLPARRPAPKELFRLTEALETLTQRALADAQMLQDCDVPTDPAWPFDEAACASAEPDARTAHIVAILDALDQDMPIQPVFPPETPSLARLEAVAQCLLLFLRALADGVVPAPLWHRIQQAAPSIPSLARLQDPASSRADDADGTDEGDVAAENDRTAILDLLQSASPNHNICFVFLTTALARAVAELAPFSRADRHLLFPPPVSATAVATTSSTATSSPPSPSTALSPSSSPGKNRGRGVRAGSGGGMGIGIGIGGALLGLSRRATIRSTSAASASGGGGGGGGNGENVAVAAAATAVAEDEEKEARGRWERRRARERSVAGVFAAVVCRADPEGLEGRGKEKDKERRVLEERRRAVVELFLRRWGEM